MTLLERTKNALAADATLATEVNTTTGEAIVVTVREKRRDRGREVADKIISEYEGRLHFQYPGFGGQVMFETIDIGDRVRVAREILSRWLNAERAAVVKEAIEIFDTFSDKSKGELRDLIANLSRNTGEQP